MSAPVSGPRGPVEQSQHTRAGAGVRVHQRHGGLQRPLLDVDCGLLAGGARGASTAERLGGCGGRVCTSCPCWLAAL
jgi:hypothetical protein